MEIQTNDGHSFHVDREDFLIAVGRDWRVYDNGLGKKYLRDGSTYLHRLIMGGQEVDHVDGDTMNNRRVNLRPCTHQQNMCNQKTHSDNKLGVKGVSLSKKTGKYRADICSHGKRINLGYFDTSAEAHAAYVSASKLLHGLFGRTT